jgi:hypothetical protein
MEKFFKWVVTPLVIFFLLGLFCYAIYPYLEKNRLIQFVRFRQDPASVEFTVVEELDQCPAAPFVVPTTGWIGVTYGDSILGTQSHSGLDIFTQEGNGVTPVYAAYDGYVTRLPEWTSAVIIRHPEDPLQPDRQIWTYYTHMADAAGNSYIVEQIPRGTFDLPVEQGALLGYQGDFNSLSPRQISTHLHFSIVQDDGQGQFLNETDLTNTLDPSPYLGMRLNSRCADRPPICRGDFACP